MEACIIFFDAKHAAAFLLEDGISILHKGHSLYGRGVTAGVEACIIFYDAEDAAGFLLEDCMSILHKGHGLYGRGVTVTQVVPTVR